MTPTIPRRPSLAEQLSPEELALLEETLDEVLREQWGPARYETYTQRRSLPEGLVRLPLAPEEPGQAEHGAGIDAAQP